MTKPQISRQTMRLKSPWFITSIVLLSGVLSLSSVLDLVPKAYAAFDFSVSNAGDKSVTAGTGITNSITATLVQGTGATTYVQDSFTGTDSTILSSHTADIGAGWSGAQSTLTL